MLKGFLSKDNDEEKEELRRLTSTCYKDLTRSYKRINKYIYR